MPVYYLKTDGSWLYGLPIYLYSLYSYFCEILISLGYITQAYAQINANIIVLVDLILWCVLKLNWLYWVLLQFQWTSNGIRL